MIIGVPKEVKPGEKRVALTPYWAHISVQQGHTVIIEKGAGKHAGFPDEQYSVSGAEVIPDVRALWNRADIIAKVKELEKSEYTFLQKKQIIFTFFHLAEDINHEMIKAIRESGSTTISLEQLVVEDKYRIAVMPMSEIAGWNGAIQMTKLLFEHPISLGVALSQFTGFSAPRITVLGGGVVGYFAAKTLLGLGAEVTIIEKSVKRLSELNIIFQGRLRVVSATKENLRKSLKESVGIVNAIYPLPDGKPIVTREDIRLLPRGGVVVDVGGGGVIESAKYTTIDEPTYVEDGRIYYGVDNSPSQFAATASIMLADAVMPYILKVVDRGFNSAIASDKVLRDAVNFFEGSLVNEEVAVRHGIKVEDALNL